MVLVVVLVIELMVLVLTLSDKVVNLVLIFNQVGNGDRVGCVGLKLVLTLNKDGSGAFVG